MLIISWNVNGLRAVHGRNFIQFLTEYQPDVLCLQEIKAQEEDLVEELLRPLGYFSFFNSAAKKGYAGVAIYTKQPAQLITNSLSDERFDQEGRLLEVEVSGIRVLNLYLPHGGREKEHLVYKLGVYQKLKSFLEKQSGKPLIITGDLNVALEERDLARPKGNKNNIMFTPEEREALRAVLDLGFIDTFRQFESENGHYSWWPYRAQARERNVGWRLDYVLAAQTLASNLKRAEILPQVLGSDHCPVLLELE